MEIKLNNKTYYQLMCEECGVKFNRRKDEYNKILKKYNGKILCFKCCKATKYKNIKFKTCSKCKENKEINQFYKRNKERDLYCSCCKKCMNNDNKKWCNKNVEKRKNTKKEWKEKNLNYKKQYMKDWREKNKKHINEYKINKYNENKEDKFYRLKLQTRNLIYKSFVRKHYIKNDKTTNILGCNFETFYQYLLQTFKNNYGYEWDGKEKIHIDHIIPLSTAKTEEKIIKLNYFTNLQLLKAHDNLEKSNKLNWKAKEEKDNEINSS